MQRLATFIRDHHEPVQVWEFRLFVAVGVTLALVVALSYSAMAWSDARQAATAVGSALARR